jgi:hypothetical protein
MVDDLPQSGQQIATPDGLPQTQSKNRPRLLLVHSGAELSAPKTGGSLANPGGGGGDDTEARLRVLEAHVEHIKAALERIEATANSTRDSMFRLEISMKDGLSKLEIGATELKGKVNHLPSKGFIVTAVITTTALIVTVLGGLMALLSRIGLLAKATGG